MRGDADVTVVCFVPDEWYGPWESRHHILSRLAGMFEVIWINPARGWWKTSALDDQPGKGTERLYAAPPPGLHLFTPVKWFPRMHRMPVLSVRNQIEQVRRFLGRGEAGKRMLYLWRPQYASALERIEHDWSCYHIDDEYTFSPDEVPVQEGEARLISAVDCVFIHSHALMEKKGGLNPRTFFVPNGVDFERYAREVPEPEDLRAVPRPRIGYVGKIKTRKHLDYGLLIELANRHREWSFVFVGPVMEDGGDKTLIQALLGMPNCTFLGEKRIDELPAYTQHMDVCTLCYKRNSYNEHINPLKLHEYLACGRPVVGSPIRSLLDFSDVVAIAGTLDEWSQAIRNGLSRTANTPALIEGRRRVASRHDWTYLVGRIRSQVEVLLAHPEPKPLSG